MTPRRADLTIAPYLTHHVTHNGQLTLIPPENTGRIRKPKEKKIKSRPKPERIDDELRFNTGMPRSLRSQAAPRVRRIGQTAQRRGPMQDGFGEDMAISIPNYPPPSFQEAISSPLAAAPSATSTDIQTLRTASISTSLSQASSSVTHLDPSPTMSSRASSQSPTPHSPQSLVVNMSRNSNCSSDGSSLEIVDVEPFQTEWEEDRRLGLSLEDRVKREWERRSRAADAVRQRQNNLSGEAQSMSDTSITSTNRRALLDSDSDDEIPEIRTPSAQVPPKKRNHLPSLRSLSPLSRSRTTHERSVQSLSPSVYSPRSPAAFLRSTTSLGRIPSPSGKGEQVNSRKLFSLKGKEKAVENELLEDWEVIEGDNDQEDPPASAISALQKGRNRGEVTKSPLLPMAGPTSNLPRHSPTPRDLNSHVNPSTRYSTTTIPHGFSTTPSTQAQVSMRDRPVPSPPIAFLNRQVRRPAPPPPSSLSVCISCAPSFETSSPSSSPATSPTKRRPPPPPPLQSRKIVEPHAVSAAPMPSAIVPSATTDLHRTFHRALEVPLPVTPLEPMAPFVRGECTFGPSLMPRNGNACWCKLSTQHQRDIFQTNSQQESRSANHYMAFNDHRPTWTEGHSLPHACMSCSMATSGRLSSREHRGFGLVEDDLHQVPNSALASNDHLNIASGSLTFPTGINRPILNLNTGVSRECETSDPSNCSPTLTPRAISPPLLRTPVARPLSRIRLPPIRATSPLSDRGPQAHQHYPGRPLPRPPGPASPIYSPMGPRQDPIIPPVLTGNVPEGLLIDFESDRLESAVRPENGQDNFFSIHDLSEAQIQAPLPVSATASTTLAPSSEPPLLPALSQYTDLDLLLSRLDDEDRTGANYETLLMVSEVVGPATPTSLSDRDRPSSPLRGRIEIDRRRVTKDGRKKLKLSLLGAPVDKCGICLSQFKEEEWGMFGECQHAFHEKCLGAWLVQRRTCPTCRASLDGHNM